MKSIAVKRNRFLVLLWVSLVGFSCTSAACSSAMAEESPGITVSGTGIAEAMPDTVEFTAIVVGNAELAGDAVEKYRGQKRRVLEALNGLNIKGIAIVGAGMSINSGAAANAMAAFQPAQANQPKVADKLAVQERLIVTVAGINALSPENVLQAVTRIVDAAKDAGVVIGSGPKSLIEMQLSASKPTALATFKLSNGEALRQQAYEAALKQAKAKAERLAQLAGVELGGIVSIREAAAAAKDDDKGGGMAAYFALIGGASGGHPEFTSAELQSIPVTVSLSVRFDIKKK